MPASEEVAIDFVVKQKEVEIENSQKSLGFREIVGITRIRAQEVMLYLPRLVGQKGRSKPPK